MVAEENCLVRPASLEEGTGAAGRFSRRDSIAEGFGEARVKGRQVAESLRNRRGAIDIAGRKEETRLTEGEEFEVFINSDAHALLVERVFMRQVRTAADDVIYATSRREGFTRHQGESLKSAMVASANDMLEPTSCPDCLQKSTVMAWSRPRMDIAESPFQAIDKFCIEKSHVYTSGYT